MAEDARQGFRLFPNHPGGLSSLFLTEMCERFAYYGMKAILIYYMFFSLTDGGLGINKTLAASIAAIYGTLIYFSSILGGFISDRILGSRRTVFIGGIVIALGDLCLALPFGGAVGLGASICLITIGTGLLKPNISQMVGGLYPDNDTRQDAGYTIFYSGINIGAMAGPIIIPAMQSAAGFHAGFAVAAVAMVIGVILFGISGRKADPQTLKPKNPLNDAERKSLGFKALIGVVVLAVILIGMGVAHVLTIENLITLLTIVAVFTPIVYFILFFTSKKVTKAERSKIVAYIPFFIAAIVFFSIQEQGGVVLALFAQEQTQNTVFGLTINPAMYQSIGGFLVVCYTPIFSTLWSKLGERQPSTPIKYFIGMVFAGLSFLLLMIPVAMFGADSKVSPLWLFGSWVLVEVGEMMISPIGLSLTSRLAPKAFEGSMMSLWFLANSAGQAVNSQIVKFYTPDTEIQYFAAIGIVAIIMGIILACMNRRINRLTAGE